MALVTQRANVEGFMTKDGSLIHEWMHPARDGNANQSLAQATVAPGGTTVLHRHHASEELYHILSGGGAVTVGDEVLQVKPGDTVCIAPGTPHRVLNDGAVPLVFLCACSPAYAHEDTELLE